MRYTGSKRIISAKSPFKNLASVLKKTTRFPNFVSNARVTTVPLWALQAVLNIKNTVSGGEEEIEPESTGQLTIKPEFNASSQDQVNVL